MPVFVAFAAFMVILYGYKFGFSVPAWPGLDGLFREPRKSPGQKSGVRTDFVEMLLDHDSGRMEGRCLKGRFAGSELASLREAEVIQLLDEVSTSDSQGAALLEAYLDRARPGWRDGEEEAGPRARTDDGRGGGSRSWGRGASGLTREEAYKVLGLEPGASREAIKEAHRRLMRHVHPDMGGTDYLAARINEAKDLLLGE